MMRRRLAAATTALVALTAAVSAVPAFTADTGSIVGTVTAGAPPAPCIQLSTTTLDYGTLSFAANGSHSMAVAGSGVDVTNCSAAVSTFAMAGTDASGPGGSWSLTDRWQICDGSLNKYGLLQIELPEAFTGQYLVTTPRGLVHRRPPTNDPFQTFNPGESEALGFSVAMPCVGSNGAGQTFSFTIGLTATVV
jgi:hypothetical protein